MQVMQQERQAFGVTGTASIETLLSICMGRARSAAWVEILGGVAARLHCSLQQWRLHDGRMHYHAVSY